MILSLGFSEKILERMGMKKPQKKSTKCAAFEMLMRERIFNFETQKFTKKLLVRKIDGGKWVGAAAERRRFFQA